ncbi:EEF1A lysine methyltransferase 3 [Paramormyrops kingsleyae]|uniref:EEF1A lysine methyltransferase 3 n=1 Tax=Paramormyrops kingsleyae TaxID=1676925 RepID=A0A3B3RQG3_9TELE|nr:EEF1A lysine methyltransferase 3 [Paramormyrops kingsleyae]
MNLTEDQEGYMFPVCDGLFAETFSEDSSYMFGKQELKIRQLFGANLGVAAPVWDAALCLCRYLEEKMLDLKGKRVIELGAGTGIVGILAARLGASVTLTDLPHAIPQLESNVSTNMPQCGWPSATPTVIPLSWGLDHRQFATDWDLVLGADIVYLSETYTLLLDTLTHLCDGGAALYLSSKMRREHGTPDFFENILPQRFDCQLVYSDTGQNISIYCATLRKDGNKL